MNYDEDYEYRRNQYGIIKVFSDGTYVMSKKEFVARAILDLRKTGHQIENQGEVLFNKQKGIEQKLLKKQQNVSIVDMKEVAIDSVKNPVTLQLSEEQREDNNMQLCMVF